MRKVVGYSAILLGLSILGLLIISPGNAFITNRFSFGTKNIDLERSIDADRLQNIRIETGSADVKVIQGNSQQIVVRLQGQARLKEADQIELVAESNNELLSIEMDRPSRGFQWGLGNTRLDMTVELPDKEWNDLSIQVSSGNIQLSEIKGKSVKTNTSSGNMDLKDIQATLIEMKASSGNIELQQFKAEQVTFDVSSGNAKLKEGAGEIKGRTSSGNIELELDELSHDADLRTNSGSVTIELDNEPKSAAVDFQAGSGKGTIEWSGIKYDEKSEHSDVLKGSFGGGETKLKVRTGSGNFKLAK